MWKVTAFLCLLTTARAEPSCFSSQKHPKTNGLTSFWAQEYSGIDLAREVFDSRIKSLQPRSIHVQMIDSAYGRHTEAVMNLMLDPKIGSLTASVSPDSFLGSKDFLEANEATVGTYLKRFLERGQKVDLFNISVEAGRWARLLGDFSEFSDAIFVTSAGNAYPSATLAKGAASSLICVSNIGPDGMIQAKSSEFANVFIAAPAGTEMLVQQPDGKRGIFGMTSGATPLVTGSVGALLSALPGLSRETAKVILKTTALKTANAFQVPPLNGVGTLNALKSLWVAAKIRARCRQAPAPEACYATAAADPGLYAYSANSEVLLNAKKAWPQCGRPPVANVLSCPQKRDLVKALRREALLAQNDTEAWKLLSCIYKSEGFTHNAIFYRSINNPDFTKVFALRDVEGKTPGPTGTRAQLEALEKIQASSRGLGAVGPDHIK